MIGQLNHVAIAVPDLKKASDFYRTTLGALVSDPQELEDHGVKTVFVGSWACQCSCFLYGIFRSHSVGVGGA